MLKPSDVFVLLKITALALSPNPARSAVAQALTYAELADALEMSTSQVYRAVQSCQAARLLRGTSVVDRKGLLGVLVHAARYVYPTEPGALARGVPTAHSAPPLSQEISSSGTARSGTARSGVAGVAATSVATVWPDPEGSVRGEAIEPLDKRAPAAAARDERFYELLALTDALRIGRARERTRAAELLEARLLSRHNQPRQQETGL